MQGIWKKYEKYDKNELTKMEQDLQGTFPCCSNELMGFSHIVDGTNPGDIYIFYNQDNKPIIWLKKMPMGADDYAIFINGEHRRFTPAKYLSLIIPKIRELDTANKYIEGLENAYEDYKKLLKIARKKELNNEDLFFLYSQEQYNREDTSLARDILNGKTKNHTVARNMRDDYDQLSEKEKVAFIVMLCDYYSPRDKELKVADPKILTLAACYSGFHVLAYAEEALLQTEDFIINILKVSPHPTHYVQEQRMANMLFKYLPVHFFDNIRVLSHIFAWNPIFLSSFGHYDRLYNGSGDIIYWENSSYPGPSQRFRKAMEYDGNFQEAILQSILYALLKYDMNFLDKQLTPILDAFDDSNLYGYKFNIDKTSFFAQQLIYYFDRDILRKAIEKFYGPFQEENKNHQNHEQLVLVQRLTKALSQLD